MNIVILLPYKENFTKKNAGAVSIPLLVFRARIENIKQSDLVSSTIKFESLLFSLKTDLIQFLDLITQVEAGQPEKKTDPIQATL